MARAVSGSELTETRAGEAFFDVATSADDPEIRRLLRGNPMQGQISLSLEREPSFFADADLPTETKQTIVAREHGRIVCMGSCAMRLRFIGGEQRRVGYLGALRLDGSVAGRFDILRRGYEFFRQLQNETTADVHFTSIAADNQRARRFLERGLRGMPRYQFIDEFVTAVIPLSKCRAKVPHSRADKATLEEIGAFLNQNNRHYQLAPCWSAAELGALSSLGLNSEDFHVIRRGAEIAGCAALWDQRSFKQTVLRKYSFWLSLLRPLINAGAWLAQRAQLPKPGTALPHAFVSHVAVTPGDPDALLTLISAVSAQARQRKIDWLTVGFAANDPRLATVRAHLPCREYRSRIYLVHWPESTRLSLDLADGCLAPETALL
jgi:hypothetical protein